MGGFHNDWYQQRYGSAQVRQRQRQNAERISAEYAEINKQQQARKQTRHDNSAAILTEHQIDYEVRGHSWLCNAGYQQLYYWPKSGKWRVRGRRTTYYSQSAQDFLNKAQAWQRKQLSKS